MTKEHGMELRAGLVGHIGQRFLTWVHGPLGGPWVDFRGFGNVDGGKKYNFIFTNLT
jgi:hypothetical protein